MIQCMSIPTVKVQTVKQNQTYYLVYIEIYKQLIQCRLLEIFSNIYCRECSDDFTKTIHDVWQMICSWQQTVDTKDFYNKTQHLFIVTVCQTVCSKTLLNKSQIWSLQQICNNQSTKQGKWPVMY
jgi:hypothetical protein